jgi:hypothetical protein
MLYVLMKKEVFDAICYIPKFEQAWHSVLTKKISFEVAFFLWMDQVTTPYIPKMNDGISIPMADKKTLFGSVVEYDVDTKWWWTYLYQSPKSLTLQSAKSKEKWVLALFLNTVNTYLQDIFSESELQEWLQRWKKIFETILRCWLKKRRHLLFTNQVFALHENGYLIDPKTKQYIFSLDDFIIDTDDFIINTDGIMWSALSCLSCAEYVGRELRHDFDEALSDEYDQFAAYAWDKLLEKWIALYATHAIEIFELQKDELKYWFESWVLIDEYRESTN